MTSKFLYVVVFFEKKKTKGCLKLGFKILNMDTKNYLMQQTTFQKGHIWFSS